jgi:hypothetical protein
MQKEQVYYRHVVLNIVSSGLLSESPGAKFGPIDRPPCYIFRGFNQPLQQNAGVVP